MHRNTLAVALGAVLAVVFLAQPIFAQKVFLERTFRMLLQLVGQHFQFLCEFGFEMMAAQDR